MDRLEEIFQAALLRPEPERAAFVADACADDPALRDEVISLLHADRRAQRDAFLDALPPALLPPDALLDARSGPAAPGASADASYAGRQMGPYTLLRPLGRGGMGAVYLAARDEPFKQYVALKIIRRGIDDPEALQRFNMERQILASLNHAHIARLLDGGITDDGQPYFAMEYVEGQPITTYCDQHRLGIEARLRLFAVVCQAVHYAHQNLVIHRDLKPSNILVTHDGMVKLLDFGIAKLLNPHLSPADLPVTRTALRPMTPEYASPEQVRGTTLTTASDVYSLGVILYELLTGHRPYRLRHTAPHEVARIICEEDPPRPSSKVGETVRTEQPGGTTTAITPASVGAARSEPAERLQRRLRGDLDNLVMMALRKDALRRYGSAEQLGQDIERYLADEPLAAHRDTRWYRLGKLVRRHRVEAVAAGIIAALMVGFTLFTAYQARTLAHERDQKELEAQKAEEVTRFVLSLFETADPTRTPGDTVMVRDVLQAGTQRAEQELSGQPQVLAQMLSVIAQAHHNLGRPDMAIPLYEKALQFRRDALGGDHPETLDTMERLAGAYEFSNRFEEAQALYEQYLAGQRRLHGAEHPTVLKSLHHLYRISHLVRPAPQADTLFDAWYALQKQLPDHDDPDVASSLVDISDVLAIRGLFGEAEEMIRRAMGMYRRLYGEHHRLVGESVNKLSWIMLRMERFTEAEAEAQRALALHRLLYPEGHSTLATSLSYLAQALKGQQRYDEAETLFAEVIVLRRRLMGPDDITLGQAYLMMGRLNEERHRYEPALDYYRQAALVYENRFGRSYFVAVLQRSFMADALIGLKRFEEAESLLLENYATFLQQRGPDDQHTEGVRERLARLYDAWGRPEAAVIYKPTS